MWTLQLGGLGGLTQQRVKWRTDVVNQDAAVRGQQACCVHQGQGVFFFTKMPDHEHAQMPGCFGQGLAACGGLKNHPGFGLVLGRQGFSPQILQHYQAVCQVE